MTPADLTRRQETLRRHRDELRRQICRLDHDPAARRQLEVEIGWLEREIAALEAP